jgi:hypothetical protein
VRRKRNRELKENGKKKWKRAEREMAGMRTVNFYDFNFILKSTLHIKTSLTFLVCTF